MITRRNGVKKRVTVLVFRKLYLSIIARVSGRMQEKKKVQLEGSDLAVIKCLLLCSRDSEQPYLLFVLLHVIVHCK